MALVVAVGVVIVGNERIQGSIFYVHKLRRIKRQWMKNGEP